MEINKETITRERFMVKCKKCNKEIFGTSEEHLLHNVKVHNAFCKTKEKTK